MQCTIDIIEVLLKFKGKRYQQRMLTYQKNGIVTEQDWIISEGEPFAVQYDLETGTLFYPNDTLIGEIESELANLHDKFIDIYFPDRKSYYKILSILPISLIEGGHTSDFSISKLDFEKLLNKSVICCDDIYKYIYVGDCKYLLSTVQNLLLSAEYCYTQYYIQIAHIDFQNSELVDLCIHSSSKSMELLFFIETFFTKLYSVLDLLVKIVYELESIDDSFSSIKKLHSAEKLWGDRKLLSINKMSGTIFEDCDAIKMVESLRNEAVHNSSWEDNPKVYVKFCDGKIIERYMLFPDFEEGRLVNVKNRKHFFSKGTKVNDMLITIHDEFFQRLLFTLKYIKSKRIDLFYIKQGL